MAVCERPSVAIVERSHQELPLAGGADPRQQGLEEGMIPYVLTTEAHDQEERRRIRRSQHVMEDGHGVAVPPLEVVNVDDDRVGGAQPNEEASQRRHPLATQLVGVGVTLRGLGQLLHRVHTLEDGE